MNYYRKTVDNTANDLKLKMQIGALTLKLSENNGNISSNTSLIDTNKNNISSNTSLIDTNKNNISSNTSLIDTNKNNISSNTSLIDTNKNNISSNASLIDTNKNNISSNTSLIDTNKNNISSNTSLIDTNKNNISSNTSLIDTNKNNISSNTSLIDTNKNNISTLKTDVSNNYNFTQINKKKSDNNTTFIDTNRDNIANNLSKINTIEKNYKLKDIIIFDIEKTNIPETVDSNNEFVIINSSLNNLKKDSYIQFDSSILLFFHKHYINIAFFHILLEYFNDKKVLIESIKMPIIGMISRHANITNSCIIKIPNDLDKIYYKLSIKLNDNQNRSESVSILDFDNKIYFKYFEK